MQWHAIADQRQRLGKAEGTAHLASIARGQARSDQELSDEFPEANTS